MERFFFNKPLIPLAADDSTFIFHPHAARTGGRTFREQVLVPSLGIEHVYCRQYVREWKAWKDLTDADLACYRAYTDLRDFQVIRLKRPLVCMALLRHPLYRTVSLYWFIKRNLDHRFYTLAQQHGLQDFYRIASEELPGYFRNPQCLRLCGEPDANLALDFIREKYIAVGLTNYLTDFVHELCGVFRWPQIDLETVPPDGERYEEQISPEFRETVLRENAGDLAVFNAIANGLTLEGAKAPLAKRVGHLSGIVPAIGQLRAKIGNLLRGRNPEQAMEERRKRRELRLKQMAEEAARGKVAADVMRTTRCILCGENFSRPVNLPAKQICPNCKPRSEEERRRMRRAQRARLRMEQAREAAATAPPGTHVCNLCGATQTEAPGKPVNRLCPSCNSSERMRSFPALFDSVLAPLLAGSKAKDALLLSPGGIERTLLEPKFPSVTISSLYNTYEGNFVKADVRDLAPFADDSFDFVEACNVIEYVPEMGTALAAVMRVLRPGGTFCCHVMDGRLLSGAQPISVTYHTDVPVDYYPKGFAVPSVKVGRETFRALLRDAGFHFDMYEMTDPLTNTNCTWWVCHKAPVASVAANVDALERSVSE